VENESQTVTVLRSFLDK
jgi:hypothetical protein